MKKSWLGTILFWFATVTFAVAGVAEQITFNWSESIVIEDTEGEKSYQIDFDGAQHLAEYAYMPVTFHSVGSDVLSYEVLNAKYLPLTENETALVDLSILKENISITKLKRTARNSVTTDFLILPLRVNFEKGIVEKLISFELSYEINNAVVVSNLRSVSNLRTTETTNSVLADGSWYKIAVPKAGVYRLDYNFLTELGINPSSIDPKKIQIFGNGGGMLPQANSTFRYSDLQENAIKVIGESDGKFDDSDVILFYGDSPDKINADLSQNTFAHEKNLYDDFTYYFLRVGSETGKRIPTSESFTSTGNVSSYNFFHYHEEDLMNLIISGREWWGEELTYNDLQLSFDLPSLANETVNITVSEMSQSKSTQPQFNYYLDGQVLGTVTHLTSATSDYGIKGRSKTTTYSPQLNSLNSSVKTLKVSFNDKGNSSAIGRFNSLSVNAECALTYPGRQSVFSSFNSLNNSFTSYDFSGSISGVEIWNVTDPINAVKLNFSGNSFIDSSNTLQQYVMFKSSDYLVPEIIGTVENQDLHSLASAAPALLILTHADFLAEANKLAAFKESEKGLKTEVVLIDQVYNEFSSGAQDVSGIRDFVKYLYDNGDNQLEYLLLMGDASYDYKNRISNNTNFIPVYESRESFHPVNSYSSDDYFGFLDADEGEWVETSSSSGDHSLDIAVGRLPVQTTEHAQAIVNKIISYESDYTSLGKWRNNLCFVADDGDGELHINYAEQLSSLAYSKDNGVNVKKLYLDSYKQTSSPSGEVSPDMTNSLMRTIDDGVLLVNYTGHGSETRWASESIIDVADIEKMRNYDRLPFFITATCEFSRYDDPSRLSGGERLVLNKNGGAVGALTTTRPVYATSNLKISKAFYDNVFEPNEDGTRPTIGQILMDTKNESLIGVNNRNFSLLGDPSIVLAYPKNEVVLTEINDNSISAVADTLKALGVVKMSGEIHRLGGDLLNDFTGTVNVIVFDKKSDKKTLGYGDNDEYTYSVQENKLFEGKASVVDGKFDFSFVIPKDIAYNYDEGKVSFYAFDDTNDDATGYHTNIIIGGTDPNAPEDNTPPTIDLYMDSSSFTSGGYTNPNTMLLVKLFDENGINTAGNGIGHEIVGTLDNNTEELLILNDSYESEQDTYKKGLINYQLNDLSAGRHTIKVKAWDTHNNSGENEIEFFVVDLRLSVSCYPNPFSDITNFYIEQNRFNQPISLKIAINDINGREVLSYSRDIESVDYIIDDISWSVDNENSNDLNSGLYFYKVEVIYKNDNESVSKIGKLLLLK